MSGGRDEGSERFAAAWDDRERARTAPPGAARTPSPRIGEPDPRLERDLDLAALLHEAGHATAGPDAETTRRMRARLMAAVTAPEGTAPEKTAGAGDPESGTRPIVLPHRLGPTTAPTRPTRTPGAAAPSRAPRDRTDARRPDRRRTRRPRLLTLSTAVVVVALGVLAVALSRGALPGDTLYGIKRASESVELGLTSGQEARARRHLELASRRLDEVSVMADGTAAPERAALVAADLQAFELQAQQGARLLLPLQNDPSGPSPAVLGAWAREQDARLAGVATTLSSSSTAPDALASPLAAALASSRALMGRVSDRADALEQGRSCPSSAAGADELGPLPPTGVCPAPTVAPGPAPAPTRSTGIHPSTTSPATTTPSPAPSSSAAPSAGPLPGRPPGPPPGAAPGPGTTTSPPPVVAVPVAPVPPPGVATATPAPVPVLPPVDLPPPLPGLSGVG